MVKIIERTIEEEAYSKKKIAIEDITKRLAKGNDIHIVSSGLSIDNNTILVVPKINVVYVRAQQQFDLAVNLAKAYEEFCAEIFFVKRDYAE